MPEPPRSLRPYSSRYWRERQRGEQLRAADSWRVFGWTGILIAAVFAVVLMALVANLIPRSTWRDAGESAQDAWNTVEEKVDKGVDRLTR
jgi:hypothetical protein